MIRSLYDLIGYNISCKDGHVGQVHDFFIDDQLWIVRYLIVDTGNWLPGKKVLIPPLVMGDPEWDRHTFPVNLTKEGVKSAPPVDLEKPVSRQKEELLHRHFNWQPYWLSVYPGSIGTVPPKKTPPEEEKLQTGGDPHLRSIKEVKGYNIKARDGQIGHIHDFIVDDSDWQIRYLVVDTKNILPGKKVLVSVDWIEDIKWSRSIVQIDLLKETIRESPPFDPSVPINRKYEEVLYDFYGRKKYWL